MKLTGVPLSSPGERGAPRLPSFGPLPLLSTDSDPFWIVSVLRDCFLYFVSSLLSLHLFPLSLPFSSLFDHTSFYSRSFSFFGHSIIGSFSALCIYISLL